MHKSWFRFRRGVCLKLHFTQPQFYFEKVSEVTLLNLRQHKLVETTMKVIQLTKDFAADAAHVLSKAFENDPYSWGRAIGSSSERFEKYVNNIHLPEVVESKVPSFIAVDEAQSNQVTGILTLEDFAKSDKPSETDDEFGQPIPAILRKCHTLFWSELFMRTGKTPQTIGPVCYFAFLAVHGSYRRRHIGEALVQRGVEEARKCGFQTLVAFCTSPRSANLFGKCGFERWASIKYTEFKLPSDGSTPFSSLPDSTAVMVKLFKE